MTLAARAPALETYVGRTFGFHDGHTQRVGGEFHPKRADRGHVAAVHAVREAQQRGQFDHLVAGRAVELRIPPMLHSGCRPSMIASDMRHDDLLGWRHAQQFGVRDQVKRVLMVLLVIDVVAHIVQKRRLGKQLAVTRVELEPWREHIEQLQRQRLHLSGMRFFIMTTLGELAYRALARHAGVGRHGRDTRRLEKQPFANAVGRCQQVARVETGKHFGRHRETGHDDVGACRVESRYVRAFIRLETLQPVEHMLELYARDARAMRRSHRHMLT